MQMKSKQIESNSKTFNSPTMSPECPDEKKYQIIEKIIEIIEEKYKKNTKIEGQKIITLLKVNGIRFTYISSNLPE